MRAGMGDNDLIRIRIHNEIGIMRDHNYLTL
jgi:hypothetical protein